MRAFSFVIAAVVAFSVDADAGKRRAGKRGKVVRVERPRLGGAGVLRVCSLLGGGRAACVGHPPEVDDGGSVVDPNTMYGRATVTAVTPQSDSCGNVISYEVNLDASATIGQLGYGAVLLLDHASSADARTLPVSGQVPVTGAYQGEYVFVALDEDRDGDAELYVTYYTCDANARVVGYGQGQVGYCLRYWVADRSDWELLRTDIVRSC